MKRKMKKPKYIEIRSDYIDDNGVIHLDGWQTDDENATGTVIAWIFNGEAYFRDPEDQFLEEVKAAVAEAKDMEKFNATEETLETLLSIYGYSK